MYSRIFYFPRRSVRALQLDREVRPRPDDYGGVSGNNRVGVRWLEDAYQVRQETRLPRDMQRDLRLVNEDQAAGWAAEKKFIQNDQFVLLSRREILEVNGLI